jgi:hypothetical protein
VLVAATNTVAYPTLTSGGSGTYSNTTFTGTSTAVANFIPTTASRMQFFLSTQGTAQPIALAPNANFAGYNQATAVPWSGNGTTTGLYMTGEFELERANVFYAGSSNGIVQVIGWEDNL